MYVVSSKNSKAVGYNNYDFGNFLWGMAGKRLGRPLFWLRLGAQYNHYMNGAKDNEFAADYVHQTWDDPADQRAIIKGYEFEF